MLPFSYLERESKLLEEYEDVLNMLEGSNYEQPDRQDTPKKQDGLGPPPNHSASKGDR